jgi:hypothetical protein
LKFAKLEFSGSIFTAKIKSILSEFIIVVNYINKKTVEQISMHYYGEGVNIIKEVQIVYRLILVNCYLLHVPRFPSQLASSGRG